MKTSFTVLTALCFIASISFSNAQSAASLTTDTLKVWGECGMCKGRIEKAALQAGASAANWNQETKMLQVTYKGGEAASQHIQAAIAAAGHDTKDITAPAAAFEQLPSCCHYQRKDIAVHKVKGACCADPTAKCMQADGCCKDGKCAHSDKDACKDMKMCKDKAVANLKRSFKK